MAEASFAYFVTDVFTDVRLAGNPLAVFPDARGLETATMQAIARELNLSETTFVLPPERGGAARVRIFTPSIEMPFAGHPTLGTAYVLVTLGRIADERFVFEELVGDVPVHVTSRADPFEAWLRTPPIRFGATYDTSAVAALIGLDARELADFPVQIVSAGPDFLYIPIRDRDAVDRATLAPGALANLTGNPSVGAFLFARAGDATFYSRMLDPDAGVAEDPATGSATGPLGAYAARYGLLPSRDGATFTSEQGVRMGRRSVLRGRLVADDRGVLQTVDIGGNAVMTVRDARLSP